MGKEREKEITEQLKKLAIDLSNCYNENIQIECHVGTDTKTEKRTAKLNVKLCNI